MKKNHAAAAVSVFLLAALTLSPWSRAFPLNDDWIYALPVKNLLAGQGLRLYDILHTQLAQIAWGWLWTVWTGFSLGALKMSTVALGAAAVWLFARLLTALGAGTGGALLGALCLAFNPLFFSLSESFMTEVPYTFAMISAAYWFVARRGDRPASLLGASLASVGASMIRPTGLLVPAGFTPGVLRGGNGRAGRLLVLWLPTLAALGAWWFWFRSVDSALLSGGASSINSEAFRYWAHPLWLVSRTMHRVGSGLVLYGLFLLPFSAQAAFRPGFFRELRAEKSALYVFAAVVIASGLHLLLSGRTPVPGDGNYIYGAGLGYVTIYGYWLKAAGPLGAGFFWPIVSALGALSSGIMASEFMRLKKLSPGVKDCLLLFALQLGFVLAAPRFFDRYFLYGLPLLLIPAALSSGEAKVGPAAWALAAALALFSWAGTADYLGWNAAKWKAASLAPGHGITAEEVAGGVDYDAWLNYERRMAELRSDGGHAGEWAWEDLSSKKAMVVFSPPAGMEGLVLERVTYRTPLAPFSGGAVFLIRLPAGFGGRPAASAAAAG